MKFTFGIITYEGSPHLSKCIESIIWQNIPEELFEIIIIGNNPSIDKLMIDHKCIKHFSFDENERYLRNIAEGGWITRKKNLITKNATFDNIVYLHDYYIFEKRWYEGFIKFGEDWDICMNYIFLPTGQRFRDYVTWDVPELNFKDKFNEKDGYLHINTRKGSIFEKIRKDHRVTIILDIDDEFINKFKKNSYVSGGYWVAKKKIMELYPLDENLMRAQGEDVEWSQRLFKDEENNIKYRFNHYSINKTNKGKRLSAAYYEYKTKKFSQRCPKHFCIKETRKKISNLL